MSRLVVTVALHLGRPVDEVAGWDASTLATALEVLEVTP